MAVKLKKSNITVRLVALALDAALAGFARGDAALALSAFAVEPGVQWGKNAAGEIEKRAEVVNDRELTAYIASIGSELAAQPRADKCPHSFKVVNHRSINVFALPGGTAFAHAGLFAAVENESPLACVLAHGRDPSGLARQIAAQAAYKPVEIARFFEKLEAAGGSRGLQFVSDHPNPGNRMKAIRTLAQARGQARGQRGTSTATGVRQGQNGGSVATALW